MPGARERGLEQPVLRRPSAWGPAYHVGTRRRRSGTISLDKTLSVMCIGHCHNVTILIASICAPPEFTTYPTGMVFLHVGSVSVADRDTIRSPCCTVIEFHALTPRCAVVSARRVEPRPRAAGPDGAGRQPPLLDSRATGRRPGDKNDYKYLDRWCQE